MRKFPEIRAKKWQNGNTFYVIRIHGRDIYLGMNRRSAKAKAARLIREHYGDATLDEAPEFVTELVERWKAEHPDDPKMWSANAWQNYAPLNALDELTPDHFEGFVRWMKRGYRVEPSRHARGSTPARSGPYSAWSIRERVTYAVRIARWGYERGWLPRMPRRPRLPAPARRPKDLSPERLAEVFAKLPPNAGRLLRFCLETGCRPAEGRLLRWDQVDLQRKTCILTAHKTAHRSESPRMVFLTETAISLLGEYSPAKHPSWVFPSRRGEPYTSSGLRSILRRHAPGVTPYQMRHTFAQRASDRGVPTDVLAGLLGHADTRTTRFYAEISAERLSQAAAALVSPMQPMPASDPASSPAAASPPAPAKARPGKSAKARRRRA